MKPTTSICAAILMSSAITACGATDEVAAAAGCETYVAETRDACLDMILRGLDVSCSKQLIAIRIATAQAHGSLFNVGDDKQNQSVADFVCSSYLGDLREARAAKDAGMSPEGKAGPKCTALAEQIDSRCLSTLGEAPLADGCKSAVGMMAMGGGASQLPREQRCEMAARMLPQ
ncbi:MAG: hypothetical protein L0H29_06720 [Sinobacteraceae bacterium]|nr:hypothetical protein [Nevskiaceae bacterium]